MTTKKEAAVKKEAKHLTLEEVLLLDAKIQPVIELVSPGLKMRKLLQFGVLKKEIKNHAEIIRQTFDDQKPKELKDLQKERDEKLRELTKDHNDPNNDMMYLDNLLRSKWEKYDEFLALARKQNENERKALKEEYPDYTLTFKILESEIYTPSDLGKRNELQTKLAENIDVLTLLM